MRELFEKYDRVVVLDTETTGLSFTRSEIIEFAAAVVELQNGEAAVTEEYDELITLSPGGFIPPEIVKLTGITNEAVAEKGISKARLCCDIARMLRDKTLIVAYNAPFDLQFIYYLLLRDGDAAILQGKDKLDLLTAYRDRRAYPHKLCNAISAYGLDSKVQNSHRAIDDVLATVEVMKAMSEEKNDLLRYVNLFGYLAKYGLSGKQISSVTYRPQGFEPGTPIYEL